MTTTDWTKETPVATDTSNALDVVKTYYSLIDTGRLEEAFPLFAPDVSVRFSDRPTISGRDNVAEVIRSMVNPIAESVVHDLNHAYVVDGPGDKKTVICEAVVVYRMLRSGNEIPHNAVTISEVDPAVGLITAQRNVGSLAEVLADHAAHADVA